MAQHRFFLKKVSNGAESELLGVIVAGKLPECGLQLQTGANGGGPSRRHAELSVVDDTVWKLPKASRRTTHRCVMNQGNTMNLISVRLVRSGLCALALLLAISSCATHPIPAARLSTSGFITEGDTNFWLTFGAGGRTVSAVEVDGVAPEHAQGPIELPPGIHKVKLKCGDIITEQEITVAAGDVYQFAAFVDPHDHHVEGRLQKIRSAGG
jgi:hypothetical protein